MSYRLYKLSIYLLVGALSVCLSSAVFAEPMAESFTVTFDDAFDELDYSLAGGDNGVVYPVTALASGGVTVGVPPNLTGPADSKSVSVSCSQPDGSGTVTLKIYKVSVSPANLLYEITYAFECKGGVLTGYLIPTLSEWALIALAVLMLGLLTYYIVRKRRSAIAAI